MPTIHTRIEPARGCGYRKPGGFYLVLDGKGIECGLLPLEVRPEIKTSRAPSWRTSEAAIGKAQDRRCRLEGNDDPEHQCKGCWLKDLPNEELVLLTFIGMKYYRSVKHFESEAGRIGISRRIPPSLVPKITVGKTAVLMAHRESSHIPDDKEGFKAIREVFSAFKPQRIEYIITGAETPQELEELEAQGITLIRVTKQGDTPQLNFEDN